jgi:hypothetical protein
MKLKALVFICLLSASSAFAQWIPAQVSVNVRPGIITAQVMNPYYFPIICSGQVFGRTYNGQVATASFFNQYLFQGGYSFAYVQAGYFGQFVNGWANAHCRPAHF